MNANNILDLLTKHLKFSLHQKGKNVFFLCPFHDDKNPSLSFEPRKKIFKCFSCQFSARNVFEFWTKYRQGKTELTPTALRQSIKEISQLGYFSLADWQEEEEEKNHLSNLFSSVKEIYQHNLLTSSGREILNYLQIQRQLTPSMIDRFALGCSISSKQISSLLFPIQNFAADLSLTNLVQINDNNQVYDYFSSCQLIFPLANEKGEIMAFASRKIEVSPGENKYNYLPNYLNYQKSALLYNYSAVRQLRVENCYLVEGFFDVISLTKLGVENCLALLGTNCSGQQIRLIRQLKKRIILFLDGDTAGREATVNIALTLLTNEIDCEIINYPYFGDPDEICRHHEQEVVLNILQTHQSPYLFILNYYAQK